jgi:hypothetical protein
VVEAFTANRALSVLKMVNVHLLAQGLVKISLSASLETNVPQAAAVLRTKLLIAVMAFIAKRILSA